MNDFFLTCKECVLESPRSFYGCFYLGPFNASQSLTVANGLRRTLLSEISGLGIQNVEIDGVEHEYSTYPGIRESILDLLLNFKEIVLLRNSDQEKIPSIQNNSQENIHSRFNTISRNAPKQNLNIVSNYLQEEFQKKPFYGYLQVNGPGIVRASDLKLPPSIQCVDPDQYIATLSENGKLNLRFTICEGRIQMQKKYSSNFIDKTSENKTDLTSIYQSSGIHSSKSSFPAFDTVKSSVKNQFFKKSNILWLDPIFTPILKVNYTIESYGSLELNPTNQVVLLEFWTNGSLHPRDALYKALNQLNFIFSSLEKMKILNNIFANSLLKSDKAYSKMIRKVQYDLNSYKKNSQKPYNQNIEPYNNHKDEKDQYWKFIGIEVLDLPFRVQNCLIQANLLTVKDLLDYNIKDFQKIPGFGTQSLILLERKLNQKGLKLNR
uniref:DNA-directed RNA polymerase n=1 Tax=Chlorotetraedron incus TaxID=162317 RepID=A0A140HAE5_9CHLO|nr:alpha subunit of RNA polymerase [Chlorotetraedron incus]AMO01144.1 alpha subunit of RNA polymerase [Chlorotetraedron incus]